MHKPDLSNLEYFFIFLRYKINSGAKQIDLARSELVDISPSYVNKLYQKNTKKVSYHIQKSISNYFGLTYDEMISEGKEIHQHDKKPEKKSNLLTIDKKKERRSQDPQSLLDQINFIYSGIVNNIETKECAEKERDNILQVINNSGTAMCFVNDDLTIEYQNTYHRKTFGDQTKNNYINSLNRNPDIVSKLLNNETVEEILFFEGRHYKMYITSILKGNKIEKIIENAVDITEEVTKKISIESLLTLYHQVFAELHEGITFFNKDRELIYSSNRWNLLSGFDMKSKKPKLDEIVYLLSNSVSNWPEVHDSVAKAHEAHETSEVDVKFKDGRKYHFKLCPLKLDDIFLGTLIINTPLETT